MYVWSHHQCNDGYGENAPTGRYKPNSFGLHDMLGNVREWVEKWFRVNCNFVIKRSCTAAEKANLLAWILSLQRSALDNKPELGKEYDFLLSE